MPVQNEIKKKILKTATPLRRIIIESNDRYYMKTSPDISTRYPLVPCATKMLLKQSFSISLGQQTLKAVPFCSY